jgi:hypothetical protein
MFTTIPNQIYRSLVLFISLNLLPSYALAITNIESERLNNNEPGTKGSISLSLDGRIGSNDRVALGTSVKLIRSFTHNELIALISRDYAEVDNIVNTDETLMHFRYLTKHSKNWGSEVFTQYQEDEFSSLAKRSLLGTGIRYTLNQAPEQKEANHFGVGFFYEEEEYLSSILAPNENSFRLNLYWAYRNKLAENIRYTSTLYFQPQLKDFNDKKGLWQNSLTISVTSTINLSLTWDIEHDTKPPVDSDSNTETSYNSVLIYNF